MVVGLNKLMDKFSLEKKLLKLIVLKLENKSKITKQNFT